MDTATAGTTVPRSTGGWLGVSSGWLTTLTSHLSVSDLLILPSGQTQPCVGGDEGSVHPPRTQPGRDCIPTCKWTLIRRCQLLLLKNRRFHTKIWIPVKEKLGKPGIPGLPCPQGSRWPAAIPFLNRTVPSTSHRLTDALPAFRVPTWLPGHLSLPS